MEKIIAKLDQLKIYLYLMQSSDHCQSKLDERSPMFNMTARPFVRCLSLLTY